MSAPPNPKADHYLAQLETALVSGQWTSNAPAKAIGGAPLSWAELFRKFRKHCPTAGVNAELAATLHAMALLGVRSSVGSELEADDRTVDGDLRFNDECVLPNEARDEARALYDKLDTVTDKSESVRCTLGYFAYALGEPEKALELLKHVQLKETDTRSQWALVERVRSLALLGMVKERLALPDSIDYYKAAISALSPPSPTNQNPANELARWGERALWRACALTALNRRPFDELMDLLRSYVTHSARWPAPFRSRHRATLLRLHLHLLTAHPPPSPISQRSGRLAWLHESRNTVGELRMVLTGSTKFPASGTRNAAVEAFVDACVRIWEVSGAQGDQSDWVIDILYWSMRYTFNSTRVLRHLSRLLAASGDIPLSKRVLTLYIKLMQHARKASDMSRHDDTNGTTNGDTMPALTEDGSDSDAVWLHSVVQGIRMLCRTGNAEDAAPFIPLLDEVLRRCHLPEAQMQEARNAANLATAVWNFVMAVNSYSDESRKKYFFNAHASLHDLAGPSAAYHRALLLSLEGAARRPEAIAAARDAVEGAPREIRGWHLLALLLAADGEYNAARDILEIGAAPAETGAASVAEPIATASIDVLQGWNEEWTGWPQADQEDWAKHDEREDALQLRMTQVAIIEVVLGPEGASKRWLEVFTWWSQVFPVETTSSHQTPEIPALALTRTMTPPTEADESQPDGLSALSRPAIQLIPPSPNEVESSNDFLSPTNEKSSEKRDRHRNQDDEGDKDKLMTKMREQVVKGRERIDTISKKIVVGVARGRSNSTSERQRRASGSSALDFSLVLSRTNSYQASSIHSRGQVQVQQGARSASPQLGSPYGTIVRRRSPSPPPPPPPPAPSAEKEKAKGREKRERRLRSELWLMSAASFRRQGRFEHARGAIQYAEACDAGNANVFTQLGLLHAAQRSPVLAGQALDKALMLDPDNVQALTHRARLYLEAGEVDLAEGIVTGLVSGPGWSTAEAWFVRAQAAGQQGRRKEQRQWLEHALFLCEGRSVRNVGDALGWCL